MRSFFGNFVLISLCATYFWAWAQIGPTTTFPWITGLCDVNYFTYWCIIIFSYVYLEVLKKLGWSKVGSLTQNGHKYSEYISQLQDFLIPKGIDFVMNRKFQENSPDMSMVRKSTCTCLDRRTYHIHIQSIIPIAWCPLIVCPELARVSIRTDNNRSSMAISIPCHEHYLFDLFMTSDEVARIKVAGLVLSTLCLWLKCDFGRQCRL